MDIVTVPGTSGNLAAERSFVEDTIFYSPFENYVETSPAKEKATALPVPPSTKPIKKTSLRKSKNITPNSETSSLSFSGSDLYIDSNVQVVEGNSTILASDTIFYNPFENKTIPNPLQQSPEMEERDESGVLNLQDRPCSSRLRPVTDLTGVHTTSESYPASSSSDLAPAVLQVSTTTAIHTLSSNTAPTISSFLQNYTTPRREPLQSLPPGDFPEPPPPYWEIDNPVTRQPTGRLGPDTNLAIGAGVRNINPDRKFVTCPSCHRPAHTIIRRENGFITHTIGVITCLFVVPCTALVYMTDFAKYKNHYCPNCDRLVGYEVPIICMSYTEKTT